MGNGFTLFLAVLVGGFLGSAAMAWAQPDPCDTNPCGVDCPLESDPCCDQIPDCDSDGVPDACEPDCDGDGIPDDCEADCNDDRTPDDCELIGREQDCDGDGICNGTEIDDCQDLDTCGDCDQNGVPDGCQWNDGLTDDCTLIPPECGNGGDGIIDACATCQWDSVDPDTGIDCSAAGYTSECWYRARRAGKDGIPYPVFIGEPDGDYRYGPHLNMSLGHIPGPADFPPRKLAPALSSLPLVSKEAAHFLGPTPYQERPTHRDVVDLITGAPLIQEIDFELSFGGAVFRHVRTFSEESVPGTGTRLDGVVDVGYLPLNEPPSRRWDWNGLFWNMGENPIFLIDWEIDDTPGDNGNYPGLRRCYLIPDAHHAIPFIWDSVTETYAAPPWFDAVMSYEGGTPDANGGWITQPTAFHVWLNRRSIKYTITPQNENLGDLDAGSYPTGPISGAGPPGTPNYGLVTSIEDRYGNAVEYTYCDSGRNTCDSPLSTDCTECCQECNQKGQIKSIKLRTADGTVAWTLLYTHRGFGYVIESEDPDGAELSDTVDDHALHSIHVYKGEITAPAVCPTIPGADFCWAADATAVDSIDAANMFGYPDTWVTEVKYLYSDGDYTWSDGQAFSCPVSASTFESAGDDGLGDYLENPMKLLKVTVNRRTTEDDGTPSGQASQETTNTLYRYQGQWKSGVGSNYGAGLRAVLDDSTINALLDVPANGLMDVNDLMSRAEDEEFQVLDAGAVAGADTNGLVTKTLLDMADMVFEEASDFFNDTSKAEFHNYISALAQVVGLDPETAVFTNMGKFALLDRRFKGGEDGAFRYYHFMVYPTISDPFTEPGRHTLCAYGTTCDDSDYSDYCTRPVWHNFKFPYRYADVGQVYLDSCITGRIDVAGCTEGQCFKAAPLDEPFFVTVVEEFGYPDGRKNGIPALPLEAVDPSVTDLDSLTDMYRRSRRIVKMNAAGFVLEDQTFTCSDGVGCELSTQDGYGEWQKFDCRGRLLERRTNGWSACQGDTGCNETSEGLIYEYEYEGASGSCPEYVDEQGNNPKPDGCDCGVLPEEFYFERPGELMAVSIKKGTGGEKFYLTKVERDVVGRPELITAQMSFNQPTIDISSMTKESCPSCDITTLEYTLDLNAASPQEAAITAKVVARTPVKVSPSSVKFASVEKWNYDANGNVELYGVGALNDPALPGATADDRFFPTSTIFDDYGRLIQRIVDNNAVGDTAFARAVPNTVDNPALALTTDYTYDDVYGLIKTVYPALKLNGPRLEKHTAYVRRSGNLEQWTFDNIGVAGASFSVPDSSPVQINTFDGDRLISSKTVTLAATDGDPDGRGAESDNYAIISETVPQYDANGRIVEVVQNDGADPPVDSLSARITYNGFGNIARQQGPDDTITRNVYDGRGRLQNVYRGTNDDHEVWGTSVPCITPDNPDGCVSDGEYTDNLVLIEKRYYGYGPTNADMLTEVRNYDQKPINQYGEVDANDDPVGTPNEDDIGWITHYEYDWKLREVWVERIRGDDNDDPSTPGASDSVTATWYDYQDRVRFVAEFAGSVPNLAGFDPRTIAPTGAAYPPDASAADIIGADSTAIRALTENVYNNRGQIEETRRYDVSDATGNKYTSTRTYYDHEDQPLWVDSANAPTQRYDYDIKNRQIVSWTQVGATELTKTVTSYDVKDRVSKTVRYERAYNASGLVIDDTNSVRTFTYNWYDDAGKLIATADYGTGNTTDNIYANESGQSEPLPSYDPEQPLTDPLNTAALLTLYEYDEAGRQTKVTDPGGIVTATQYDGLGRVVMVTDNETANPLEGRYTAYQYDAKGRMAKVASIDPSHFDGGGTYATIPWVTGPVSQVTAYEYDAEVVEWSDVTGQFETVSGNNAWISKAIYPDPDYDQQREVRFFYRQDGQVLRRIDQRQIALDYEYDAQNRLSRIEARNMAGSENVDPGINDCTRGLCFYDTWMGDGDPDVSPIVQVKNDVKAFTYGYTDDGMLASATSWLQEATTDGLGGYDYTLSEANRVEFAYGGYQQLTQASQQIGTEATPKTVAYNWETADTGGAYANGLFRLSGITYPDSLGSVSYGYGTAGEVDDLLSRLVSVSANGTSVADYGYLGTGRRVYSTLGGMAISSQVPGNVATGLDRWGRVLAVPYNSFLGTPLEFEYGYDKRGNRTFARIDGLPDGGSWLYKYDGLSRLTQASQGDLDAAGTNFTGSADTWLWNLDARGNWSGGDTANGSIQRFTDVNVTDGPYNSGAGDTELASDHHQVNSINEISTRNLEDGTQLTHVYDDAGSLVYDQQRFYEYDAWNRLVAISDAGTLSVDAGGELVGIPGDQIVRFEYDALGRRIRTHWIPSATTAGKIQRHLYGGGAETLVEYDVTENINTNGQSVPISQDAKCWFVHGESFPDPLAMVDLTGDGDEVAGSEEFLFYLKDALGSVGGLLGESGLIREWYTYSPYGITTIWKGESPPAGPNPKGGFGGEVVSGDPIDPPPPTDNTLGTSAFGNPFMYTGQRYDAGLGTYHFWARTYDPQTGRWLQRDKLGLLSLTEIELGSGATGPLPSVESPSGAAASEYADAFSLYVYARSTPSNAVDPDGRESNLIITRDWDDIYDSIVGNGSAYLGVQGAATFGATWGGNVTVLPDGAMAAAGISEGFSDFADEYANQVRFLPIEGALAGLGGFARFAAVGTKGTRFARAANSATRLKKFDRRGIRYTAHFINNLLGRKSRGVSERKALRAYDKGRLYYDHARKSYIRHDPVSKVSVVVDRPSNGLAVSVFEGKPNPRWNLVKWRPGTTK